MDKKEKREYLKPYRYFSGFVLMTGIFASILNGTLASFQLLIYSIIENDAVAGNLAELISYGAIVYAYYVGYRIFVRKFEIELVEIRKFKVTFGFILELIACFVFIRTCWYLYYQLLDACHLVEAAQESVDSVYLSTVLYTAIIAPVAEELVFRGFLFKQLRKYNTIVAVFFTSLSFGLFHGTYTQWLPAAIIGLVFAVIDLRYDSIIPSVILHIASNTYSVAGLFITLDADFGFVITLAVSVVLLIILLAINMKKIRNTFSQWKTVFWLSYRSAGYILFVIIYAVIITVQIIITLRYS